MKELSYEDWQKNPTPRMMWVWDSIENNKQQRKVIYFHGTDMSYPIIALSDDETDTENFKHCAEIEKQRRMTNKELSWWLSEKPHRARKSTRSTYICTYYTYHENEEDEEVPNNILIRENDGEWREPLVEVEE